MRPRRWMDGLFLKAYLKVDTEGVAGSGVRLWMRSLDGGGRGRAEIGYFVSEDMRMIPRIRQPVSMEIECRHHRHKITHCHCRSARYLFTFRRHQYASQSRLRWVHSRRNSPFPLSPINYPKFANTFPPRSYNLPWTIARKRSHSSSVPVCSAIVDRFPVLIHKTKGGTGQLISRLTNDEIDVAM